MLTATCASTPIMAHFAEKNTVLLKALHLLIVVGKIQRHIYPISELELTAFSY